MQETRKHRIKRHIGYGAGYFPDSAYYTFFSTYQLLFLTSVVGLDAGSAGTIVSLTIMGDAVFSIVVGRYSDNLRSKFGRRRPLILFTAFSMPASYLACFYNLQASHGVQMVYYMTVGFLYWSIFAVYFVSFLALGADVATDYEDRILMVSTSRVFNVVGELIGSATLLVVVAFLMKQGFSQSGAWFTFVAALSLLSFIGILICWRSTRGQERILTTPPEKQSFTLMLKDFQELLRIKPYRLLIWAKILISFSFTTYTSCIVFYITYKLGISPTFITPLYMVSTLAKLGFVVVVAKAALKYGKKEFVVASTFVIGVLSAFFFFYGITSKLAIAVYVLGCVYAQASFWQLCNTNFYDVTDLDEYRYGKRREGNLMALQSLICVIGISVTLKIITGFLNISGFDATLAVQTSAAINTLEIIFILFPAIGLFGCSFFMSRYKVSKSGFILLREYLYRKEQGLEQIPAEDVQKIENMFR
ncbi:MAG: MFS transporter [Clostridia bacterium]|nr:MFS transporter [Clostridia bacterium]